MAFLIGTDEAGYGPNLGPLVISATVWRVDSVAHTDLYSRLPRVKCRQSECSGNDIVVADSKELYKPGKGLGSLETGVLTFLAALGNRPKTWGRVWKSLAADEAGDIARLPWYQNYDGKIPVHLSEAELNSKVGNLVEDCSQAHCAPVHIESRAVFPPTFNRLVETYGNKASALSNVTLSLVRSVLGNLPDDEPAFVLCDKHGGRNKYGPLLNDTFPDRLAVVRCEGREESIYWLGAGRNRREIVFRAKGEEFLPSALASMVSKYLRELAMQAFNQYWATHVVDLKPTAGYPLDAKRFKNQIASAQKKLGIKDVDLWRCR